MVYFTMGAELGLTEEQTDAIETFIRKNFVTRSHYDKRIAEQDAKIEELSNLSKESSEHKKAYEGLVKDYDAIKIKLEKTVADYESKIQRMNLDHVVLGILEKEGARNVDIVRSQLKDQDLKLESDGSIPGLMEQIQALKKDPKTSFLFYEDKLQGTTSAVPNNETKNTFINENPATLDEFASRMSNFARYLHPPQSKGE